MHISVRLGWGLYILKFRSMNWLCKGTIIWSLWVRGSGLIYLTSDSWIIFFLFCFFLFRVFFFFKPSCRMFYLRVPVNWETEKKRKETERKKNEKKTRSKVTKRNEKKTKRKKNENKIVRKETKQKKKKRKEKKT